MFFNYSKYREARDRDGKLNYFNCEERKKILKGLKFLIEVTSKTLDTDINGFYHILKSTIPILKEGGGGSITALTAAAVPRP